MRGFLILPLLALAACQPATSSDADAPNEPPAVEVAATPAPVDLEVACRQAVEALYGQAGEAVMFDAAEATVSWRAPVDGGRLSFACRMDDSSVALSSDGETQTWRLTPPGSADAIQAATPSAGENYWTARAEMIAAGFTPVDTDEPPFAVCTEAMEQQRDIVECPSQPVELPEVEACAGTGLGNCRTNWAAPGGRRLIVFTVDGPQPGIVQAVEWADTEGRGTDG